MANEEHHNLAGFIKRVHEDLRCRSRDVGPDEAWRLHCEKSDTLERYASAMKLLATKYWDPNAADITKQAQSRIQWVVEHCIKYFNTDFLMEIRMKEESKWRKLSLKHPVQQDACSVGTQSASNIELSTRLRMLDVGSCYNPFKNFKLFEVVPIDIAPASPDVHKCDFLNVNILSKPSSVKDFCSVVPSEEVTELGEQSFDIIVFSLLLEYLPSVQQRYSACLKAYELLKSEGLLFIITPDSKNPSANAPLMKKWRIALASVGYIRVFYEKLPHIHCMAFRKTLHPLLSKHLGQCLEGVDQLTSPEQLMAIPQDNNVSNASENEEDAYIFCRTEEENTLLTDYFAELPS